MGTVATAYLVIGALCALAFAVSVKKSLDHRGEHADLDAATDQTERAVAGMPGGMAASLLVVVLFWPAAVVLFIRNAKGGGTK